MKLSYKDVEIVIDESDVTNAINLSNGLSSYDRALISLMVVILMIPITTAIKRHYDLKYKEIEIKMKNKLRFTSFGSSDVFFGASVSSSSGSSSILISLRSLFSLMVKNRTATLTSISNPTDKNNGK